MARPEPSPPEPVTITVLFLSSIYALLLWGSLASCGRLLIGLSGGWKWVILRYMAGGELPHRPIANRPQVNNLPHISFQAIQRVAGGLAYRGDSPLSLAKTEIPGAGMHFV